MDRTQLKTLFADILEDVTGENFRPLHDEQMLKDELKLDSLDMVSIAVELQDRIGVTIEVAEVNEILTVDDFVRLVHGKLPASSASANAA